MASPNLSEIVTTTLRNRTGKLRDNVSDNTILFRRLKERGKVVPVDGGVDINEELEYAENGSYTRYSGYQTVNIQPSDVFTAATFAWKQAAVAVSISGLEELQNAGRERVINLVRSRVDNAERTFVNNLSADMYSDGTASGGKQVGGLQHIIADSPTTGTVGGINRASFSFWQNQTQSGSSSTALTAANIQDGMNSMWVQLVRNNDKPDIISMDNNFWLLYLASLQTNQRFASEEKAAAGFNAIKFMSADVLLDGGFGGDAPTNHAYFINTNYLHWRPHRDRNMVPLNPDRFATNQDAHIKLIGWAGNLTCSNASLQGVLINP